MILGEIVCQEPVPDDRDGLDPFGQLSDADLADAETDVAFAEDEPDVFSLHAGLDDPNDFD